MIKLFEEYRKEDIKKYIVFLNISTIEILKHTYKKDNPFNRIYTTDLYYLHDDKLIEYDKSEEYWIRADDINILFTSNNLEKCKEYIFVNYTANKYNL